MAQGGIISDVATTIPMSLATQRTRGLNRIVPTTTETARHFIATFHYLGNKGFLCSRAYALIDQMGRLNGCAVFHPPSSEETVIGAFGSSDQGGHWELGRLALRPSENGGNSGSFLVSGSIRLLSRTTPTKSVIAYSDSDRHVGAVYQAANFTYCGMTDAKKDFFVGGMVQERGRVAGVGGEWRQRPRKHRYIILLDKRLNLLWQTEPYPKKPYSND